MYLVGTNKTVNYPTVVKHGGMLVTTKVVFIAFVSYFQCSEQMTDIAQTKFLFLVARQTHFKKLILVFFLSFWKKYCLQDKIKLIQAQQIIMQSLDPLRAKKIFIRKKLGHTAVSAIKNSSVTLYKFIIFIITLSVILSLCNVVCISEKKC